MRIGIDARVIFNSPILKGVGVYLANLLYEYESLVGEDEICLFYDSRQQTCISPKLNSSKIFSKGISVKKGDRFCFWEQFALPKAIKEEKVDIFHGVSGTTSVKKNCPTVVTVHDAKSFLMKHGNLYDSFYYNFLQPRILKHCQRIICPTEFSKRHILEYVRIDSSKIIVIPQGLNKKFHVICDDQLLSESRKRLRIMGEFILCVAGETPLKNITGLIEAYAQLKKRREIPHKLVVTGIRDERIKRQHQKHLERLNVQGHVMILGFISDADLGSLYNLADLFVYPSLFEGFGFPPIEAMACGTPVAASNATSIPEVVGDAALLFDGRNIDDMAAKIYQLLSDEELQEKFRGRGFERIKKFEWQDTARKTYQVYNELLA